MVPRELIPVLIELHLVGRKMLLYSPTHALIPKALDGLVKRFDALLVEHGAVTIGVGPAHLVYQDEPLDPTHMILKELTHTLATAHVALITFQRGLDASAVTQLFSWLRATGGSAEARQEQLVAFHQNVSTIRIIPVTFKRAATEGAVTGSKTDTWSQLLDALMEAGLDDSTRGMAPDEAQRPEHVAQLINRAVTAGPAGAEAARYERLVLAHLQRLAVPPQDPQSPEPRSATLPDAERKKLATLIEHLDPPVRERLFKLAFAPGGQGPEILHAVLDDLSEPVLLEVLYQIQSTNGSISIPTLELLRKFVSLDREQQPALQSAVQTKLERMDLADRHALYAELFQKKSDKNYYPDPYAKTIKDLSGASSPGLRIPHAPMDDLLDAVSETEIHAHLITVIGELLRHPTAAPNHSQLVEHLAAALNDPLTAPDTVFHTFEILKAFHTTDPTADEAFRAAFTRILGPILRNLTKLEKPHAATVVDHILSLGAAAVPALLDVLNSAKEMVLRKRLLEVLVKMGRPIAGPVMEWLKDPRWFVVRNMIFLLGEVRAADALAKLRPFATHAHEQVRLETLRALGLIAPPDVVADTLAAGVLDRDERVASCAISILCQRPTARIGERIWALLQPGAVKLPEGRQLKMVEALARSKDPASHALLSRLSGQRRFLFFNWSKHAVIRKAAREALRKHQKPEENHGRAA